MIGMLALRRSLRDGPLVLVLLAITAVWVALGVLGPRLLGDTIDRGAREAVAAAGHDADVVLRTTVIAQTSGLTSVTTVQVFDMADALIDRLTAPLQHVAGGVRPFVVSDALPVTAAARAASAPGEAAAEVRGENMRIAALTPDDASHLRVVAGVLPGVDSPGTAPADDSGARTRVGGGTAPGAPVEVAVTAQAARQAALAVGDTVTLGVPGGGVEVRIAAIVEASADGVDDAGFDLPGLDVPGLDLAAVSAGGDAAADDPGAGADTDTDTGTGTGTGRTVTVTALAGTVGMHRAEVAVGEPFSAGIRLGLRPERFTAAGFDRVSAELRALDASTAELTASTPLTLRLDSDFDRAMSAFPPAAAAAAAQMGISITAMLVTGGIVLALASRLLVSRRAAGIALERARGASLVAVGSGAALEAGTVAVAASVIGVVAADLLHPGEVAWPLVAAQLAVAVLTPLVVEVGAARTTWHTARRSANPRDRRSAARRTAARRLVAEGLLVVLTVGAVLAVVQRGIVDPGALADTGAGSGPGAPDQPATGTLLALDPLVALAPVLVAATVAVLAVRAVPLLLRPLLVPARASRGAAGLLIASSVQRGLTVLPVFATTLAIGLLVAGGSFTRTVDSGQDAASLAAIGGDARAEGDIRAADVQAVAAAPGVSVAAALLVAPGVDLTGDGGSSVVSLVAVTADYARIIDGRLDDASNTAEATRLRRLVPAAGAAGTEGRPVDALADAALIERYGTADVEIVYDGAVVPVHLIGSTGIAFAGETGVTRSRIVVDIDTLSNAVGRPLAATSVVAAGPGAAAALSGFDDAESRVEWLAERRDSALVAGTTGAMRLSTTAAFLLSLLAVVAAVAAGARDRATATALLRTLGGSPRVSWWLALTQVVPLAIASVVGGAFAGAAILYSVGGSLGLDALAGATPALVLVLDQSAIGVAVVGTAVALGAAIALERLAAARRHLPSVLRAGETP